MKTSNTSFFVRSLIIGSSLLLPLLALAQAPPLPAAPFSTIDDLLGTGGIICNVFRYLFFFLILVAVIFILLAAFKYVTRGSDPNELKSANMQILFAAVAVVLAFIARQIPNIALTLVGGSSVTTC